MSMATRWLASACPVTTPTTTILTAIFWMKHGEPVPCRFRVKKTFENEWHWFSMGRWPSCHPTNSVKAVKETRNSDPSRGTITH